MEAVSILFKQSIPHYFENLPIPNSIGGWFRLGIRDWLYMVPLGATLTGIGYVTYRAFCPRALIGRTRINPDIHKENAKHVDTVDIENIGDKAAFCRCWRSKKWPYCDGSHGKFNKATGDNTGPIVIKRSEKAP